MDNLTHSLFGLTLARTPLGRGGRTTTLALLLASNAPDIDIVATAGGVARYLEWHRGPTHGPLGVIGLGLLVAALVWSGDRWWNQMTTTPRVSLRRLWIVSMVAVACHTLMDLPTSYGIRALSPFAWTWFAEDWEPIVDFYLLAILGACLWFGRTSSGRNTSGSMMPPRTRNAAIALSLMVVNYGVRATAHHEAIARAGQIFGAQLPSPCEDAVQRSFAMERWPFDSLPLTQGRPRTSTQSPGDETRRCLVEIAAMPDFASPLRWRLIAQLSNAYEVRTVDFLSGAGNRTASSDVRLIAIHYPNVWTPTVMKAAHAATAQVFLGFSRFPAARSIVAADGTSTVRWTDLRFVSDSTPGLRERTPNLFTATVQLSPDGTILRERFGS